MNYIGIDLGTSSVKGLLMSSSLDVLYTYSQDYPSDINGEGWSEQNPEDWYEKSLIVIKELIKKSSVPVLAISFSGQMHSMVVLDENDQIIRPAILWNDQRTTKECDYLNQQLGRKFLIKNIGNIALTGYTAPKILWMKTNEAELFSKIDKIMLPKDYLVYCLTGIFATDFSDASGTLYLDVKNKCWSKQLLNYLGIEINQLPKLFNSFDPIGKLTNSIKQYLEIEYDIKVIIGGGDQAVGSVGTATVSAGDINISLGTSGVVFAPTEKYVQDGAGTLHSFCDATGKYHKMGVALNSGGSMNWWTSKVLHNYDLAKYSKAMLGFDDEEPLYFLPYLIGERSPIHDANIRGCFLGLAMHHTDLHLTRAIMEGVAFSIAQIIDSMNLCDISNVKITGGGSRNPLWVQIIADVIGYPVKLINVVEGAAFGAALLACAGDTNQDVTILATRAVDIIDIIFPSEHQELYQRKFQKWLKIYPALKNIEL